ncbi:hypothetical protein V1498_18680 [Peribacillus sp. SCS-26]|uniref:hypothetical protein n=1 Tax=Paraperibacillus marinus TaxID=3115295 RepID=UPI0039064BD6
MRGNPKLVIEKEQVYKTKKNPNGTFIARIIEKPREKERLDYVLLIQNFKTKQIVYDRVLITSRNSYNFFRIARGEIKWVSLYTVGYWDGLNHKVVEVSALTGKEKYLISDEVRITYL